MKYYKTIHEITVSAFFKVMDTDDYSFMLKKKNNVVPNEKQIKILETTYAQILDEYNTRLSNKKDVRMAKEQVVIKRMNFKFITATELLELYSRFADEEILGLINELGFFIDIEGNIDKQILSLTKKLTGLKNKIKIKQSEFAKKYKIETTEDEKPKVIHSDNLDEQATRIELFLELKYQIDVNKTKLIRWCNWLISCRIKREQYEQAKN